jgi:hypothetical protein
MKSAEEAADVIVLDDVADNMTVRSLIALLTISELLDRGISGPGLNAAVRPILQ